MDTPISIADSINIALLLVFLGYAVYAQARDAKEHDDLREESESRWKQVEESMRDIDARIQTAHQQIAELHRSPDRKAYTLDELIDKNHKAEAVASHSQADYRDLETRILATQLYGGVVQPETASKPAPSPFAQDLQETWQKNWEDTLVANRTGSIKKGSV